MRLSSVMFALALTTGLARAEDKPGAHAHGAREAAQAAINGQIDAFRHDDAARAFGYATPHIRALFGSAEGFMAIVRHDYRPVYRPQSITFGETLAEGGKLVQEVELIGPDGRGSHARYVLERQADGSWKIDACELSAGGYLGI